MKSVDSPYELAKASRGPILAATVTGSRLFGTNTAKSDTDYTFVFRMPTRDLVMQRYVKSHKKINAKVDGKEIKNTKDDTDAAYHELQFLISAALGGQPFTLELLYAPTDKLVITTPVWDEVRSLRHRLRTNNLLPFMGYCKKQAAMYSNKAVKFQELNTLINRIEREFGPVHTMGEAVAGGVLEGLTTCEAGVHVNKEGHEEDYVYLPDYKTPFGRKLKDIMPDLHVKLATFGARTRAAAEGDCTDLKAYYHALRVIWMMEEYLETGEVQFPGPRVADLMDVRNRKYSRPYIESWIADEEARVMALPNSLPEPDRKFWDEWVQEKYMEFAYTDGSTHLSERDRPYKYLDAVQVSTEDGVQNPWRS